ncbi:hypothetical protein CXB51_013793 [Gossypium anomalum]|uniref:DUF7745 domain-containing protein n=1 Tax=Gossypium anomalum TaxID=47600 RepID=A0A8J5YWS9_9ROSI|nr:hypothetical protein CXB51_013793 [Gossypium anomalum]
MTDFSPRALGYVDEATTDLFHRLSKRVTSVPAILAETFRSLGACRRAGAGMFIGCAQLLLNWIALLQNLQSKDVEWKAPWMIPGEILYRCGSFDWVPLLGIWGTIGYAPLLVLRQYGLRQFVPVNHGLAQSEFVYKGADYKRKGRSSTDRGIFASDALGARNHEARVREKELGA